MPYLPCFEVDLVAMAVHLNSSKLIELKQEVDRVNTLLPSDRSCTKKDFESLVGRLAHASQVIQPGKTFMRSLFELLASWHHCKPWNLIHLNVEARADLLWWSSFILSWNDISIIPGMGRRFFRFDLIPLVLGVVRWYAGTPWNG